MQPVHPSLDTLRFGPFVLDPVARSLTRDGHAVQAEPKVYEALHHLARHPGRLVTRDDLLREVWPDVRVSDDSVSQIIRKVRKTLGDRASRPRWVKTEHGKGYRFVGTVDARPPPEAAPGVADDFFGRAQLLTGLARALAVAGSLVTLVGPGGIGKTRLALEYLGRTWQDRQGSAWFVDCSGARTTHELCQTVARSLDVPLTGDAEPSAHLGRVLSHRGSGLLVADNVEQVIGPARSVLDEWRHAAPAMTFLATSRTPLALPRERVVAVGPLDLEAARQLFHARAGTRDEDGDAVAALVERLDGDPLSIELAATRAAVMSPLQILERVDQRLSLLGRRSDDTRHGSLRNNLQWTWELLDDDNKELLVQCSGFLAGFPLDAAESVAELPSGAWPGDVVQDLVTSGLLRPTRSAASVRLRMAEALRLFSQEQAAARPDRAAVDLRRAQYLADLGDRLVQERKHGTAQGATLPSWFADLRVAWAAAMPDHPDLAARLALAMHAVWKVDGPYDEAVTHLQDTLAAGPSADLHLQLLLALIGYPLSPDVQAARLAQAEALAATAGSALRSSQILDARADATLRQGKSDEALALIARAMPLARDAGDPDHLAGLLGVRANALRSQGRFDEAATSAAEGLAMGGVSAATRAALLQAKAIADQRGGRLDEALAGIAEFSGLVEDLGDRRGRLMVASFMAVYGVDHGDPTGVDAAFAEALTLVRELGDTRSEARILANLCVKQLLEGKWAEAAGTARRAAALAASKNDRETHLVAVLNQAVARLMGGDAADAQRLLEQTESPGGTRFAAWARLWAAVAAAELGQPEAARAHLTAAKPMLAATADPTAGPSTALADAVLCACTGDVERANHLAAAQDGESFHKLDLLRAILRRNLR